MRFKRIATALVATAVAGGGMAVATAVTATPAHAHTAGGGLGGSWNWDGGDWGGFRHAGWGHHNHRTCVYRVGHHHHHHGFRHHGFGGGWGRGFGGDLGSDFGGDWGGSWGGHHHRHHHWGGGIAHTRTVPVHARPHNHSRIVGFLHKGGYTVGRCGLYGHRHHHRHHHWGGGSNWGGNWGGHHHHHHHGLFRKVKSHFKVRSWDPRTGFTHARHLHKRHHLDWNRGRGGNWGGNWGGGW